MAFGGIGVGSIIWAFLPDLHSAHLMGRREPGLEYFYNIYQEVADERHGYTDWQVDNYQEEEEFSQYALSLTTQEQLVRLEELRGLVPRM